MNGLNPEDFPPLPKNDALFFEGVMTALNYEQTASVQPSQSTSVPKETELPANGSNGFVSSKGNMKAFIIYTISLNDLQS